MADTDEPIEINQEQPDEPVIEDQPSKAPDSEGNSKFDRFKFWYSHRKKWTIPASVLIFLLVLGAIPITRNNIAGLVLKKDLSIKVLDATANTPVSGATVASDGVSAQTDGTGKAVLHHLKPGHHKLSLSKKYYQDRVVDSSVSLFGAVKVTAIDLTATGRQVKITVTNLITKQTLANVDIKVADISAKTDNSGSATVVLPVGSGEQKASLSLDGYNDSKVSVKASNDKIQENNFALTPTGQVYFLSKLSGKIDVVKTNLDGSSRQTVLAGTGNEQDQGTVLLASRDWKYLALLSRRAGSSASLYLINTSDDSLTTMDEGDADFSLNGWVGDNFVYTVTRNGTQLWQANRQVIKSYSAPAKKAITLDQTTASGSGSSDYITELIGGVYAYNDQVFYIKNWTSSYTGSSSAELSTKQATLNSVKPDGSAKKAIKSFGLATGTTAIDITLEERVANPEQVNLKFSDGTKDNFYVYANGQVKDQPSQTSDGFYSASYSTYLQSPSGDNTFWSDPRDGKNTLFIGDDSGQNAKQLATLSDYNTYGWYTDNYLLVSKNSSELYAMSKDGKNAIKISDYHKPALTFNGYGGGYGGL